MQDLESTRKAFEAYWKSEFIVERADDGRYYDSTVSTGWKHWCRALDYAAEQQAAQCQCDMRTKLVGDGCSVCNPEKAREDAVCEWQYDDHDCKWASNCGEAWQFMDGDPDENNVRYCQGCGRKVKIQQQTNQ